MNSGERRKRSARQNAQQRIRPSGVAFSAFHDFNYLPARRFGRPTPKRRRINTRCRHVDVGAVLIPSVLSIICRRNMARPDRRRCRHERRRVLISHSAYTPFEPRLFVTSRCAIHAGRPVAATRDTPACLITAAAAHFEPLVATPLFALRCRASRFYRRHAADFSRPSL